MAWTCPLCEKELRCTYRDGIGWTETECSYECTFCKLYNYDFSYGYTIETFGKGKSYQEWHWTHKESWDEELKRIQEQKAWIINFQFGFNVFNWIEEGF